MMSNIFALVAMFWVVIGVVLVANGYFVFQVRMARYRVMQTLAEKGQPVPADLFNGPRRTAHVGMLRGAIVLISLGSALGIFFWAMTAQSIFHGPIESAAWLPSIALFPILLGVALLLMALLERGRPN